MLRTLLFLISFYGILAACQDSVSRNQDARILAIGDSLLSWNSALGSSIPDVMAKELGQPVVDRSFSGAWMLTRDEGDEGRGLNVPYQYEPGNWDWVVVNGGGNDLLFGCGCGRCGTVMNRLISEDGESGQIPDLIRHIRAQGARVIYPGYLRSPNLLTPIEHCKNDGDELEARIARFADTDEGVFYISMQDIVPPGGLTYFAPDLIHPSRKTSRKVAERLASAIRQLNARP
ncbi:SGNH/GDSL hydrolase family protein [Ruegeria pomeroyi]|uniref:SGNH/GDSL hydrolase family protein n=1 Tax=Ruegeria alba TaxID=2916756 RepID=A0ABS9NW20_9RHOB|nr:SGNH/GDSL hydrolase family protein [Ruegeria alba]MCE8512470.1 SGNH/GDSL hydrolase family protein [Ruegeria pomeroyi]MCE8521598.1 SGNH/GDSL hydrolase family protein [Ruegeria pomeroyi]MCE8525250.1 SGNH/GDSL hydrolase family protein [Ruegeria pomeroyi]MCE8529283.1 SGNH/GDSL hydrolase family protein [Ruegeria pomeroyi]MCE8533837.1 SGNH/GDSL hydrolase family protein [Ruegeria pomeroyi]